MSNPHDVAICGYVEAKNEIRSGKSTYEIAGALLDALVHSTGLEPRAIDGLAVGQTQSECRNPFYAGFLCDALGLEVSWLNLTGLAGCSALGGVARAVSAIRDGQCSCVLVISTDAPTTRFVAEHGAWRDEFQAPIGVIAPPANFGLIMSRYAAMFGLDAEALARIAVTQRSHGLLNDLACEKLRVPLSREEYLASRLIADPLRLLDCVMLCDGGSALLVTRPDHARRLGLRPIAYPVAYAEVTNLDPSNPVPDTTHTGFARIAPRLFSTAGLTPADLDMVQLYDDFTIAVLMQLEELGFCARGGGAAFILNTDLSYRGKLPLNTGGGQISAGQPGLAGGGVNLCEAVRQLAGAGGARQVANARNALVTGIGMIPYARNWSTSAAMILEAC